MFGANTLLTVYMAPKDAYTYHNFRQWHARTKRRWRQADVMGADEVKVMENNRRQFTRYKRKLKIFGWTPDTNVYKNGRTYQKVETVYQDIVGDPYFDYFKKFFGYILDWWGVGGKFTKKAKKARNVKSVPNTPMLDVSIGFDSNSIMEKMYLHGMDYEEAIATTFKGRSHSTELITELTEFNKTKGMDDDSAYKEAMRMVEIVQRNVALDKNSPTTNEYNFMMNYYNKFIDKKMREMMKIQINFWFLKEVITHNPNLSLYVLGPYNVLYRIHGIVSKKGQNVIVQMEHFVNSTKYDYEYTYSLDRDTMVDEADKGYIPARKLLTEKSKILNAMHGRKKLKVHHRYRSETFYDIMLEGHCVNGVFPWFDAMHNCWASPDYSNPKNLRGLDIIC
jgi:hypothetical protein